MISLAAVLVSAAGCFYFSDELLRLALEPAIRHAGEVYFFAPHEAFTLKVKAALLAGLFAASPIVVTQTWLFLKPALRAEERKWIIPIILATSALALTGALFAFFVVVPAAFGFLISMQTGFLKPMVSAGEYFAFLTGLLAAFAVAFNLPVFVSALSFVGVVRASALRRSRRQAVVLIFVAAAVLTPGPDIVSQLCLAVPLIALFEASVAAARFIEWSKRKKPGQTHG